jgi:transcription antitermination factor NusG
MNMYHNSVLNHRYRLQVRKNTEKRFCDNIMQLRLSNPVWNDVISDVYYPQSNFVRFKGKSLELSCRAMIPGLLYLKMKMGPDVADDIENSDNVYGFAKKNGIVLPISEDEGLQIENHMNQTTLVICI